MESPLRRGTEACDSGEFETALRLLLPLAEAGEAEAQDYLGRMFRLGHGVDEDAARAMRWCRAAAGQGNLSALHQIGVLYIDGQGVAKDSEEAVRWFRRAAYRDDEVAYYNLALLYRDGLGVERDCQKAWSYFHRAARRGHEGSLLELGDMEESGVAHLPPKPVEAYAWFRLATERGVETAAAKLAELGAGMTAEEVAEAESIVKVWYRYIVPRG